MRLNLIAKRRLFQAIAAVILTCNLTVFSSSTVFFGSVCLPIIHCNACPLTWFNCPIYMLSESVQFHSIPWLVLGLIAGFGVFAGRFFCGWICPAGLLQDVAHSIPSAKFGMPVFLRWTKYIFLIAGVGVVAYIVGKDVLYFFCSYCPVATVEVLLPEMISGQDWAMDTWRIIRLSVLVAVLVVVLFSMRGFCKVMCPVGALVAVANKFSLFTLRLDPVKCIHCGKCDKACPMQVPVEECSRTGKAVNRHSECIECLTCEQVCPVDAIRNNSRVLKK